MSRAEEEAAHALLHTAGIQAHHQAHYEPAIPIRRGTSNANARGNTEDRRRRRQWLLQAYASDHAGCCRCYRCGCLLIELEITVDRIVPGCLGGRYTRSNIRPACAACNSETGGGLRK